MTTVLLLTTSMTFVEATREFSVVPDGYMYSSASLRMLVADNENVVAHGGPNTHNVSENLPDPDIWYVPGDSPPIIAATKAGSGQVVASGGAGMMAYDRPLISGTKTLILNIFDWLDPTDNKTLLWYEGRSMYYAVSKPFGAGLQNGSCQITGELLENEGWTVHSTQQDTITREMLEPYKILVINCQIISPYTTAERAAIENWVKNGGGGLFFGIQSDYGGYQRNEWMNPILADLDANFEFQDDQLKDNIEWIDDPFTPRLYLTDHPLNKLPLCGIDVTISPDYRDGLPGSSVTFTVTLTNKGTTSENYDLEVNDEEGWTNTQKLSDNKPFIGVGASVDVTLTVDIPSDVAYRVKDKISVTATNEDNADAYDSENCTAYSGTWLMPPEDDSQVVEGGGDNERIFGGSDYGYVGSSDTEYQNERTFMKFDLSQGLPSGYGIQSAILYLYCFIIQGAAEKNVQVFRVENVDWSERVIKWIDQPTIGTVIDTENIIAEERWYSWDVTSWAQTRRDVDNLMSLCLKAETEGLTDPDNFSYGFDMKDYDEIGLHPYLAVENRVETYVSPRYQEGLPLGKLKYTVEVANRGAFVDDYTLAVVENEWKATFSDNPLTNMQINETREVTLTVEIPENARICIDNDNMYIRATSWGDVNMSDNYRIIAHAAKRLKPTKEDSTTRAGTGLENGILGGSSTVYVGRYRDAPERGWLQFDLQGIPSLDNIVSARLYLFAYQTDNGGAAVQCHRVDNDNWMENEISWTNEPSVGDLLDTRGVPASDSWYSWDVTDFVREQFENDNIASFAMVDLGEDVNTVNHTAYFRSKESATENEWPYLEILCTEQLPEKDVRTSISPIFQGGVPGMMLDYTVTVKNTGTSSDTYNLSVDDNLGWGAVLYDSSLSAAGSGGENSTTLHVTIPGAPPICTLDRITVTATGAGAPDDAMCYAHRSKADFSLEDLYTIRIDFASILREDVDNLVAKFKTYGGGDQGENLVWENMGPYCLTDILKASHPQDLAVEKVELVLSYGTGAGIATVATKTISRDDLFGRIRAIKGEWPYADEDERDDLFGEIRGIKGKWPYAS